MSFKEKLKWYIKGYDPRVVKKRWSYVTNDPYSSAKFNYTVTKFIIIFLCVVISYNLLMLVVKFDGRSSLMTLGFRIGYVILSVYIVFNIWDKGMKPAREALKHYEANPATIGEHKEFDVVKEVDDILEEFDKKKVKGGKKNGNI